MTVTANTVGNVNVQVNGISSNTNKVVWSPPIVAGAGISHVSGTVTINTKFEDAVTAALRAELGEEFWATLRELAEKGASIMDAIEGRRDARVLERAEIVEELREIAESMR